MTADALPWIDRWEARLRPAALPAAGCLLVVLVVVLTVRALRKPELGDTRFYRGGAQLFVNGDNLYLLEPPFDRTRYNPNTGYTYPPPFAAFSLWMLALPYAAVRVLWLLAMTACMVGCAWLALRLTHRGRAPPARPIALGLLASCLLARFALNDLAHGQVNWLVTLLILIALLRAEEERPHSAGLALGLALALKPTSWLLLPYFLIARRDLKLVGACLLTLGVVLALPGLRYGSAYPQLCADWFLLMERFSNETAADPANISLASALVRLGAGSLEGPDLLVPLLLNSNLAAVRPVARGVAVVAVGLGFAWVCWRRPRSPRGAAAILVLGALLSPVTWKAHLVVLTLPVMLLAARVSQRPGRRSLGLVLVLGLLLLLPTRGLLELSRLESYGTLTLALIILWVALVQPEPQPETNDPGLACP